MSSSLSGLLDFKYYTDNNELDHVDQYYLGNLAYQLTSRLNAGVEAGYTVDHDPGRDILETGLTTLGIGRRNRFIGSMNAQYDFSELTDGMFLYEYYKDEFVEEDLLNTEGHTATLGFRRNISDLISLTEGLTNFEYIRYKTDVTDSESYAWTIGAARPINDKLSFSFEIGPRYVFWKLDTFTLESANQSTWRPTYEIALFYDDARTLGSISFARYMGLVSGRLGPSDRTTVLLDINRRFAEKLYGALSVGFYINKSFAEAEGVEATNDRSFRIEPRLLYKINMYFSLEASYAYTKIDDRSNRDIDRDNNTIFMRLYASYPLFE